MKQKQKRIRTSERGVADSKKPYKKETTMVQNTRKKRDTYLPRKEKEDTFSLFVLTDEESDNETAAASRESSNPTRTRHSSVRMTIIDIISATITTFGNLRIKSLFTIILLWWQIVAVFCFMRTRNTGETLWHHTKTPRHQDEYKSALIAISADRQLLGEKNVKTFRWDHRLQRQNLFLAVKRVPRW